MELNQDPSRPAQINFIHSAVGKHEGTISFLNTKVPVNSLDNLLREPFKFIKIDVDGMEMEALQGVSNYLETYRPKIMIEVLHSLDTPFKEFLKTARYRVIASQDRFNYTNFLIEPSE